MEDQIRRDTILLFEKFGEARGIALTTVSKYAAGDARWYDGFISGEDRPTVHKVTVVWAWLSENWPDGARWPKGIKRPEAVSKSA